MNDRHIEKKHIATPDCEKLGQELLSEILCLSEKHIQTGNSPRGQAMAQAAISVRYAIKTFLLIASLGEE